MIFHLDAGGYLVNITYADYRVSGVENNPDLNLDVGITSILGVNIIVPGFEEFTLGLDLGVLIEYGLTNIGEYEGENVRSFRIGGYFSMSIVIPTSY